MRMVEKLYHLPHHWISLTTQRATQWAFNELLKLIILFKKVSNIFLQILITQKELDAHKQSIDANYMLLTLNVVCIM